ARTGSPPIRCPIAPAVDRWGLRHRLFGGAPTAPCVLVFLPHPWGERRPRGLCCGDKRLQEERGFKRQGGQVEEAVLALQAQPCDGKPE
ncbi:MAG: hypothetical protein OEY77_14425, partial [Nitrospira sp.]|nr:hypothetical protein [Nitrospira sp.]